jgi:ketosteroid isomerase-like protein
MDVQELLDKQQIHEALMRYARGVDRGDAALICSAYHPDAVDEHGVGDYTGVTVGPGIVEMMADLRVSSHHITNHLITVHDATTAGCESYFTVWQSHQVDGTDAVLHALGRYVDRFEKRDGEWRIAHRLVIVEHTAVHLLGAAPPPSAPGRGSRNRDDPSYQALAPQTVV